MAEISRIWLLFALLTTAAFAQPPAALHVPFDDWLKEPEDGRIEWSLSVIPPVLTEFQRLATSVVATLDAKELARRNNPNQLLFFLDIRDQKNRSYRIYRPLTIRDRDPARPEQLKWAEGVCILPGEYEIVGAIYDTLSKEHSLRRRKLRVEELQHDPLPAMWSGLPAIENEAACYQSRLSLPLKTQEAVRIDLIVNRPLFPDSSVGPRLRVLSEIEVRNGSMTATAVDPMNRRVRTQPVAGSIDEEAFWAGFPEANPNKVDAHALDLDRRDAQYFVSGVSKRLKTSAQESRPVFIILSERRSYPKNEDSRPIQVSAPSGSSVFYIRCNPPPAPYAPCRQIEQCAGGGRVVFPRGYVLDTSDPRKPVPWPAADSLERLLDTSNPRLFDVSTPLEFRRALAEIMSEISRAATNQ